MRRSLALASCVTLLGPVAASPASAQEDGAPARPLVRVRPADGPGVQGRLVRLDADSVAVMRDGGPVVTVGRRLASIDVGRRRSTARGMLRKGSYGFVGGAIVGAVAGYASYQECTGFCILPTTRAEGTLILGAVGGLLGGAIGALVGAVAPGTMWSRVPAGATDVVTLRVSPRSVSASAPVPSRRAVAAAARRAWDGARR